jgi:hypothetical protein
MYRLDPSSTPSVNDPDGFKALYAMDAYQHVKDGTPYPAYLTLKPLATEAMIQHLRQD